MKKVLAFTLAETLIVMGVVGVVAALTLPNLNSSTGNKEKVAKVKKVYENLNDAFGRAEAVYGPFADWTLSDNDTVKPVRIGQRIFEFMKTSQECEASTDKNCFGGEIKKKDGTTKFADSPNGQNAKYKIITADGTSIAVDKDGAFIVDIDGPTRGKNANGHDIFYFDYVSNARSIMPKNYNDSFSNVLGNVKDSGDATYASAWIVNYDNADYLKVNSSSKCTNNTSLEPSESSPRCK